MTVPLAPEFAAHLIHPQHDAEKMLIIAALKQDVIVNGLRAELAQARGEIEKLRNALRSIDTRFSALEYVGAKLDNDAQCALHEALAALAPEGKEGG